MAPRLAAGRAPPFILLACFVSLSAVLQLCTGKMIRTHPMLQFCVCVCVCVCVFCGLVRSNAPPEVRCSPGAFYLVCIIAPGHFEISGGIYLKVSCPPDTFSSWGGGGGGGGVIFMVNL